MWQLGDSAGVPDADFWLSQYYGPNEGYKGNMPRFRRPEYDCLYEQYRTTPHGPARNDLVRKMVRIIMTYAPVKVNAHRIFTDMWHPWVLNYRRHAMLRSVWKFLDIDVARQPTARRGN